MDHDTKHNIMKLIEDNKDSMQEYEYLKMCNFMKYVNELEYTNDSNSEFEYEYQLISPVQNVFDEILPHFREMYCITGPRSDTEDEVISTPTIYHFLTVGN